jgi:hypothetical protein
VRQNVGYFLSLSLLLMVLGSRILLSTITFSDSGEQFLRLYCFVSLFRAGLVSLGFPTTGRVDVSFGYAWSITVIWRVYFYLEACPCNIFKLVDGSWIPLRLRRKKYSFNSNLFWFTYNACFLIIFLTMF